MAVPEYAEWKTVWLGRHDAAAEDGILPVVGDVRDASLAVFEQKVTVGDATKDSDDVVSSLIVADLTGGGQVEDLDEGSDANRFWDAVADTRSAAGVTLPPLASEVRPSGVTGATAVYPLGDAFTTGNAPARFAVAFGTGVYLWDEAGAAFGSASATALGGAPTERGTAFRGTGSQTYLFVPLGAAGHATVTAGASATPTVANVAAAAAKPAAQSFTVWNNQLWCLATDGRLWYTVDGSTWAKKQDGTGADLAPLDPARSPKKLLSYFDATGESQLYVVTDRDVWTVDLYQGRWTLTTIQPPPHPDFGLDACVWRPGEDLWVAAGADCVKYTAAGVIVPLAGLARDDGLPAYKAGRIVSLQPEPSTLWALVQPTGPGQFAQLHGWTGVGWHKLWEKGGTAAPSWLALQASDDAYRLWWGLSSGYAVTMPVPREMYNARQGLDAGVPRAASGHVVTGWFDASMSGFDKLASHVTLDLVAGSPTETVAVGYLADDDGVPSWSLDGSETTAVADYAAFGSAGTGSDDLGHPTGVAVDAGGNVWVADTDNHRVQKFDAAGTWLATVGSFGSGLGQLNGPGGVAVDAAGNLWVADTGNHRLQKFSAAGAALAVVGSAGSAAGRLSNPLDVAVDGAGDLWVADNGNHRIQRFTAAGVAAEAFGSFGSGAGQFNVPAAVAVDGSGNVWVADSLNHRVQKIARASGSGPLSAAATVGAAGAGAGQLLYPNGVAVDAAGNLWVADTGNHRVQKFSAAGVHQATVGSSGSGDGQFSSPRGLAVDGAGHLWVADCLNSRVQEFDAAGAFVAALGATAAAAGRFAGPAAVAADGDGNLWVADAGNDRVQKFDAAGGFLLASGSAGAGDGQFDAPGGVAVDAAGNVWVADTGNHRVQKLDAAGAYQAKFGSSGSGDGQFSSPRGLAVDGAGHLWVADFGNDRLQRFDAAGAFQAKFGASGSGDGQLDGPAAVAVDGDGNLWVADSGNHRVQKFDAAGAYLMRFGSAGMGNGQLLAPAGVAVDDAGRVWVADAGNGRVQVFDAAGAWIATTGTAGAALGAWNGPAGMCADGARVRVADAGNNRVQSVTFALTTVTTASDTYPATFAALGAATAPGVTRIAFDPDADGFAEGLAFNRIRFLIALARSPLDATRAPFLRALTFHYTKIPQQAGSWAFDVALPAEGFMGRMPGEIRAYLRDLQTAGTFLKFVHNGQTYRVRVAGVSGVGASGQDEAGTLQVSLIEVRGT